jgi:putative endonuclease
MPYYVYMILCDDGSFYTGYTRSVASRMRLHMIGKGARYTRIHKPRRLVYTEEFGSRAKAMKRERRLKTLRHDEKLRLTRSQGVIVRRAPRRRRH